MRERKKLCDILHTSGRDSLKKAWDQTKAAADLGPLPSAEYIACVLHGTLANAKTGTPCYKLTFQVLEGDHAGRRFWHDIWLTPAAMPMAKRDLAKIGIADFDQLDIPLPPGIRCKVKLALWRDDAGVEFNRVKSFEVVGIDTPAADPFAPADPAPDSSPSEPDATIPSNGAAAGQKPCEGDAFPFGANRPTDNGPYQEGF